MRWNRASVLQSSQWASRKEATPTQASFPGTHSTLVSSLAFWTSHLRPARCSGLGSDVGRNSHTDGNWVRGTIQVPMCQSNPQGSYSSFLCVRVLKTYGRPCKHTGACVEDLRCPVSPLHLTLTKLGARLMAREPHRSSHLWPSLALGL